VKYTCTLYVYRLLYVKHVNVLASLPVVCRDIIQRIESKVIKESNQIIKNWNFHCRHISGTNSMQVSNNEGD
jgi:hypothetical protein